MLAEDKGVDALGANLQLRASRRRRRVVSSQTPVPSTAARQAGKLPYLPVMISQGLVATRKMPLNPFAIIAGTMLFTIFAVAVSSSSRL